MKGLRLSLLLLLLAPLAVLHAAPAATSLYEIEVVVFENRLTDLEGGEFWTSGRDRTAAAEKEEMIASGETPPADSALSAAAAALEKSGRHRVLAHLRWQQAAEAKSVSKAMKISSADGGLDGSLRFYLSRFLILDLNLALREAAGTGFFGGAVTGEPLVYRLNEPRRIKVSETHYFDHPKFGALVLVSPAKAPAQP